MEHRIPLCDCDVIHKDVVDHVERNLPPATALLQLSNFFKVFGDGTRIRILYALDIHEMCVCDLAVLLNMTKSAISHQLRSLRMANLVKHRREGKNIFYSLKDHHVKLIIEMGLEHINEPETE